MDNVRNSIVFIAQVIGLLAMIGGIIAACYYGETPVIIGFASAAVFGTVGYHIGKRDGLAMDDGAEIVTSH